MVAHKRKNLFSLLALTTLVCLGLIAQNNLILNLPNSAQDFLTLSLSILYESLPFVFLGTFLAVIIGAYLPENTLTRILPRGENTKRATLSLSGMLLPVCECGNVPLSRGLIMKGVKPALAITFLLAAPIINPITLLTTHQAFSGEPKILIIRLLAAFIIANFIGWLLHNKSDKEILKSEFSKHTHDHKNQKLINSLSIFSQLKLISLRFREELEKLLPALVIGCIVAGIIQTFVPRSLLLSVSSEPILAILAMMGLAFIISICANVDAFFALALSGIFPTSAILAFLIFGPMIDIKMLSLLRTTFSTKILVFITCFVFLSTLLISLAVQYAL